MTPSSSNEQYMVYFVQPAAHLDTSRYKIGISNNTTTYQRLFDYGINTIILQIYISDNENTARYIENLLIQELKNISIQYKNEFFDGDKDKMLYIFNNICKQSGAIELESSKMNELGIKIKGRKRGRHCQKYSPQDNQRCKKTKQLMCIQKVQYLTGIINKHDLTCKKGLDADEAERILNEYKIIFRNQSKMEWGLTDAYHCSKLLVKMLKQLIPKKKLINSKKIRDGDKTKQKWSINSEHIPYFKQRLEQLDNLNHVS